MKSKNVFILANIFVVLIIFCFSVAKCVIKRNQNIYLMDTITKVTLNEKNFHNGVTLILFITPYFDCVECGSYYINGKDFIKKISLIFSDKIEINYVVFGKPEETNNFLTKDFLLKGIRVYFITKEKEEMMIRELLEKNLGTYKTPIAVLIINNQIKYVKQFIAQTEKERGRNFSEFYHVLEVINENYKNY